MKLKRIIYLIVLLPLLFNCGGKENIVEPPPPTPVNPTPPDDGGNGNGGGNENPGGGTQTNPWDANRGKVVTPTAGKDGWTSSTVREGIVYYHLSGAEAISGVKQEVFAVDLDLNNPNYKVTLTRTSPAAYTSTVHKNNGAIATINAGYEAASIFIRCNKTDYSIIPNTQISDTGQDNWKSEGAFYIDSKGAPGFVFVGSPKRDGIVSGIKGTTYANAVKMQRNYYMNTLGKDTYPFLLSSAPTMIDDYQPLGETFCDYTISDNEVSKLNSENLERHQRVRHPRTAVGLTEHNHLILMVVDGRQTTRKGMSCRELTQFMVKWFNPQYALNLDGGGSTAMCIENMGLDVTHVVNEPIDSSKPGQERARDTHIMIVEKK